MSTTACPLCGAEADVGIPRGRYRLTHCDTCGDVRISFRVRAWEEIAKHPNRHLVSAATRLATEHGNTEYVLGPGEVKGLLLGVNTPAPEARLDEILEYIRRNSSGPEGRAWITPERDYPLGYARNPEEFLAQLDILERQGRVQHDEGGYWVPPVEWLPE